VPEFLVSTHHNLLHCATGGPGEKLEVRSLSDSLCYGMTVMPNGDYMFGFKGLYVDRHGRTSTDTGTQLQVWAPDLSTKREATGDMVDRYLIDAKGERKTMHSTRNYRTDALPWFMSDVHQIKYDHEGLYLTDPACNHMVFLADEDNLKPGVSAYYSYGEIIFNNTAYDFNHPNSIYTWDSGEFAVLLHNRGNWKSEIVFGHNTGSKLTYSNDRLKLHHYGAHNMLFTEDVDGECVTYNASEQGTLVKMNIKTREIVREVDLIDCYPKGLDVMDGLMLVGASENTGFWDRFHANAAIRVVDAEFNLVGNWDLGRVGGINDILVLS